MTIDELDVTIEELAIQMNKRFDSVDEQLAEIKKHAEITKGATNTLVQWADECSEAIRLPIPRIK